MAKTKSSVRGKQNKKIVVVKPYTKKDGTKIKTFKWASIGSTVYKVSPAHNYIYVGKVGRFCPMKPGCGGGILLRQGNQPDKYSALSGTKGYRWLEAEVVKANGKEDDIDKSYYISVADQAIKDISEFDDYEWFVSDD